MQETGGPGGQEENDHDDNGSLDRSGRAPDGIDVEAARGKNSETMDLDETRITGLLQ